jgi:hypothetical protein
MALALVAPPGSLAVAAEFVRLFLSQKLFVGLPHGLRLLANFLLRGILLRRTGIAAFVALEPEGQVPFSAVITVP